MSNLVREKSRPDTDNECSCIRGRSKTLSLDAAVSKRLDNSREEVGETGERVVAAEVNEGMYVWLIIAETGSDLLPVEF